MFNLNSMLVKTWVRLIESGVKTREDVPRLFNLQDAVKTALTSNEEAVS